MSLFFASGTPQSPLLATPLLRASWNRSEFAALLERVDVLLDAAL